MSTWTYVARRKMNVDGRAVQPGDEVPEAAAWPNVDAYLRTGHLERERAADKEPEPASPEPVVVEATDG